MFNNSEVRRSQSFSIVLTPHRWRGDSHASFWCEDRKVGNDSITKKVSLESEFVF